MPARPKMESSVNLEMLLFRYRMHMERMHHYRQKCEQYRHQRKKYNMYYRQYQHHKRRMRHYYDSCYPQYRMESSSSSSGYGSSDYRSSRKRSYRYSRRHGSSSTGCDCGC